MFLRCFSALPLCAILSQEGRDQRYVKVLYVSLPFLVVLSSSNRVRRRRAEFEANALARAIFEF